MRKAPLARAGFPCPSVEMATQATNERGMICMAQPKPWTAWVANRVPATRWLRSRSPSPTPTDSSLL